MNFCEEKIYNHFFRDRKHSVNRESKLDPGISYKDSCGAKISGKPFYRKSKTHITASLAPAETKCLKMMQTVRTRKKCRCSSACIL